MIYSYTYISKRSYKLPIVITIAILILPIYIDYGDKILFNLGVKDYLIYYSMLIGYLLILLFCTSKFSFNSEGILLSSIVKRKNYWVSWDELEKIYLHAHKDIAIGIKRKDQKLVRKYLTSINKKDLQMILYIFHINGINVEQVWISNSKWKEEAERLHNEGKIPKFR